MKDPISVQSTQAINIPVGNFKGDKLRNVQLIELLSNEKLLNEIGVDCRVSSSLYEPLIDEPAHLLPDIHCICGQSMTRVHSSEAYQNDGAVWCDACSSNDRKQRIEGVAYHCPKQRCAEHKDGWDLCEKCAGLQIRTFFERKDKDRKSNKSEEKTQDFESESKVSPSTAKMVEVYKERLLTIYKDEGCWDKVPKLMTFLEKNKNDLDTIHEAYEAVCTKYELIAQPKVTEMDIKKSKAMSKQKKWGKGGMMLSVGCGLLSEEDMGKSYEIEVYLYPSRKYRDGKCLCIITTSEGTTANIIEQGKREKLQFAKNGKECDWGIERFDTSTEEGRINERTGKSAETDMIIYFIPVQEDKPQPQRSLNSGWNFSSSSSGFSWGSNNNAASGYNYSNNSLCLSKSNDLSVSSNKSWSFGSTNSDAMTMPRSASGASSRKKSKKRSRSRSRNVVKDRSRSRSRSREAKPESLQLKFAKHKMTVSDRQFDLRGRGLQFPLKRIRDLPIRAFLRGAVFFDQTKQPDLGDALRLSNYLQSRYNDTELLSIHSYSVLIKQRAKLLPVSEQYYRNLHSLKKKGDGVYDLYFTEHAKKENELCVVCMDKCIDMVMVDCHHMCLCKGCSTKWTMSCPICRSRVRMVVKEDQLDKNEVKIIPMAVSG